MPSISVLSIQFKVFLLPLDELLLLLQAANVPAAKVTTPAAIIFRNLFIFLTLSIFVTMKKDVP